MFVIQVYIEVLDSVCLQIHIEGDGASRNDKMHNQQIRTNVCQE